MEGFQLGYKIFFLFAILLITLLVAMYATWAERKVAAFMQDRRGPNRAGPLGLLQPLADGLKMLMKEEIIPNTAQRALFIMGPAIAMTTALLTGVVIPWGGTFTVGSQSFSLQVADLDIGILFVFAMVSIGVYGIMLGGWASNNKYALLGSIRAASQMISYELAMGLSIIALVLVTNTLSLREIVEQQSGWHWNILYQPLGFVIFLICAFAETNRAPFDLPECETELIGGFHTEYSSMKLGFYLFAEYINMFISSAVIVTLYFGGYQMPLLQDSGLSPNLITLLGSAFFFLKIFLVIFFFMWVRWTLPRFRYDQLMNIGWKGLVPLAILNILITGSVVFFSDYFK
ncbi:MAG TPA: NADH-quinone oxidoreductase subunit NuoH [Bacteroidales bacterium]|nr:NADH-quinone oxidoreductase subunit NuoH [Bacteroidales bacterium]HSA42319.1 NADH-quinone oxidoreductase subunit NuoH [Bacteroidales bacterium]